MKCMILERFPPKEFYQLPVTLEKILKVSLFLWKLWPKKNRDIFVGHPVKRYVSCSIL